MKTKKDLAVDFINYIRETDTTVLTSLIKSTAGEELAAFFYQYSYSLITKEPDRVIDNCSALMLMGYLIHNEEQRQAVSRLFGDRPMGKA